MDRKKVVKSDMELVVSINISSQKCNSGLDIKFAKKLMIIQENNVLL